MNGIDTILRRLDTDAKAEADAVLKKARQEAADITARYQASPEGRGEAIFSAADRETAGQAAVDAANAKTGGHLMLSAETAPIRGGFLLRQGSVEVNCAFETLVRLQKTETAGLVARKLFD